MIPIEIFAQERQASLNDEVLLGARMEQDTVTLTVVSNGCTKREDFTFKVGETAVGPAVTFRRSKPDMCKRMPHPKDITFTLQELGIQPGRQITVVNRIDNNLIRR